ncbi:isoaspartyl peptidase/L-asparaginase [Aestuariibacter halophilus]|uniref:Isoaspartyl peptidase/L-asparaginase n=1 Tax=Fluctibacter halophilus TaxID=226011 RepID=A0ABS8G4S1_9ALTE|nr:isoaspartyl peptidase/L-asparaginase [Aestuariibacter halophilus]MCC2615523.1 isoaspartyl peptidase/L-asparaginase [Aestuariibacter halophilus]
MRRLSLIPVVAGILVTPAVLAEPSDVAIALHGGAGTISKANLTEEQEQQYRQTLRQAVTAGYQVLQEGKPAMDAVIEAIQILENSSLFNAGKGAVYTYDGTHELDASLMDGATLQAGAVAGVKRVKNPILAARAVMALSPHVMLSGEGADTFAAAQGLTMVENNHFDTPFRRKALEDAKARLQQDTQALRWQRPDMLDYKFGTVGAVARDQMGNLAAGTSTGGMTAKRFGRVGDSPIIGAGTFADNRSCAVSATGHGEYFIRYHVAGDVCARVRYAGASLSQAASDVIHGELFDAGGTGGIIAIDSEGNIAMPFNTEGMYRASVDTSGKVTVAIYGEEGNGKIAVE